jgi:hypothetical protein
MQASDLHTGRLVSRVLRGSWREVPPATDISVDDFADIAPLLAGTGLGGLGWWVARKNKELARSTAGQLLRDVHRSQALHAAIQDRKLELISDAALAVGIEPLLVKGWTVARRYPARGLRLYGDFDLVVEAAARTRLVAALHEHPLRADVDLEHAFIAADVAPIDELLRRSRSAEKDTLRFRVLDPSDDLRLLAMHYLRTGGWRALSLVDVAIAIEQRPRDIDWDLVLASGDRRRAAWFAIAATLAHDLLEADLSGTPLETVRPGVPSWLLEHVLRGFATLTKDHLPAQPFEPARDVRRLFEQARERWPPDPLAVTLHHGRSIRHRPPRALQIYDYVASAVTTVSGAPRHVRLRAAT